MSETQYQKLIDELDVLDQYTKDDFQLLDYDDVEMVTDKAVLIDGVWVPKSQMRTDPDGELYVIHWLFSKVRGN